MKKTAFITGATSGIGYACAKKFASENFNLILIGRRKDRLTALKFELEKSYNIKVLELCFDVQQKEKVFDAVEKIPAEWKKIDVLINNAGLSLGRDSFEDADIKDWDTMLQTNVNGLLYVTKALLPIIKENNTHIINIGSVAGKQVYENGNVYCASKFAVDAISKSMRIDLLKYGIKVTAIHPGAVKTEFSLVRFKGDKQKADSVYEGFTPLSAEDIADTVFYASSVPEHVCLNEINISCTQQADAFYFNKNQ